MSAADAERARRRRRGDPAEPADARARARRLRRGRAPGTATRRCASSAPSPGASTSRSSTSACRPGARSPALRALRALRPDLGAVLISGSGPDAERARGAPRRTQRLRRQALRPGRSGARPRARAPGGARMARIVVSAPASRASPAPGGCSAPVTRSRCSSARRRPAAACERAPRRLRRRPRRAVHRERLPQPPRADAASSASTARCARWRAPRTRSSATAASSPASGARRARSSPRACSRARAKLRLARLPFELWRHRRVLDPLRPERAAELDGEDLATLGAPHRRRRGARVPARARALVDLRQRPRAPLGRLRAAGAALRRRRASASSASRAAWAC